MTAATALPIRHAWNVMGTVFTVDVRGGGVPAGVLDRVVAFSHRVDALFSPFKRDSEISLLNAGQLRRSECSPSVRAVLDRCDQLEAETGGYFDVRATGSLDPSGYVKGWAIGEMSRLLVDGGSERHSVNGGGDVQCYGDRGDGEPWRIGIAHPLQPMTYVDVAVGVGPLAVATSGTAERGAHIVNPQTGKRPIGLASVTVIGSDIALVDVMATTCIAMGAEGPDWLRSRGMQGVVVHSDATVERLVRQAA
jgi:thiamine biosynthesis lipoprotein